MDTHLFFLQVLAILLGARVLGEVAARLNIPAVIGEIIAGVVLGVRLALAVILTRISTIESP